MSTAIARAGCDGVCIFYDVAHGAENAATAAVPRTQASTGGEPAKKSLQHDGTLAVFREQAAADTGRAEKESFLIGIFCDLGA